MKTISLFLLFCGALNVVLRISLTPHTTSFDSILSISMLSILVAFTTMLLFLLSISTQFSDPWVIIGFKMASQTENFVFNCEAYIQTAIKEFNEKLSKI